MHVLRSVRVLLAVLILAAVVGAVASVLSARPDLQKAKHNVDTSWSTVATKLDARYVLLANVDKGLQDIPGPVHTLVGDVDTALTHWKNTRVHSSVASQVDAANSLEALARRLVATASASPRVVQDAPALTALNVFLHDTSRAAAPAFNQEVTSYQRERRGPIRTLVASILGDGSIPVLDTTVTAAPAAPA